MWIADTPTIAERAAWLADLDAMLALDPLAAPPGHAPPHSPTGVDAIRAKRDYIPTFDAAQPRAQSADALIATMRAHYPTLEMDFILDLGARVSVGEVQWP